VGRSKRKNRNVGENDIRSDKCFGNPRGEVEDSG